jgi:hypothetical protein
MIFWNFKTPITFLACVVWNTSEFFDLPLGKFAPTVFELAIGCDKKNEVK